MQTKKITYTSKPNEFWGEWKDDSKDDYNDWADFSSMISFTDGKPKELKDGTEVIFHAVVMGENDEYSWWWLYQIGNTFFVTEGECDYTGWDCQSDAITKKFKTLDDALKSTPKKEAYTNRPIQHYLERQIKGKEVIGVC